MQAAGSELTVAAAGPAAQVEDGKRPRFDLSAIVRSPAFLPALLITAGILACFWTLLVRLPGLYFSDDGYYSHGILVPFIVGYIVYRWWPTLKTRPVKPGWFALVPLAGVMYVVRAGYLSEVMNVMSLGLILTILLGIWFVAGWRWMLSLTLPSLYLVFGLPDMTNFIERYTNSLQLMSSSVSMGMLRLLQLDPWQAPNNPTYIYLPNYSMEVAVACSGLKLLTAVVAFTAFFMLIGNLKAWANMVMVAMILPLCLFINGLRIAIIGAVGNQYGSEVGAASHDYSGYITLVLCFIIIFKVARLLGWKN